MTVSYGRVRACILRPARARHGDPTGPPTRVPIPGDCLLFPANGDRGPEVGRESTDGRDQVTVGGGLVAPAGTDIRPADLIEIVDDPRQVYEVIGEPAESTSPSTGWNPGVVAYLTRWEG